MLTIAIYIQDTYTSQYNRVDLFSDEKISVVSSIQNINDISKTYTDYSQTFTVPASKQNNKIFRHWYDNSNEEPFQVLTKSNAYIEIDTITFRKGKIQLESANVVDGHPQDYSITFIGILGNLKDIFAGKYLKDLTSDVSYDYYYNGTIVRDKVTTIVATQTNIVFPLISSDRNWNYNLGGDDDVSVNSHPIRFNELFPAIRLSAVLNMIKNQFQINFDGAFLTDSRFTNAFLWLKNSEVFTPKYYTYPIDLVTQSGSTLGWTINTSQNYFQLASLANPTQVYHARRIYINFQGTNGASVTFYTYINSVLFKTTTIVANGLLQNDILVYENIGYTFPLPSSTEKITFSISVSEVMTQSVQFKYMTTIYGATGPVSNAQGFVSTPTPTLDSRVEVCKHFPEIKIEDFFSGLLKMFNLTCYSNDGYLYTLEQLESYYGGGSDVDITKYVLQDKSNLNRVKTYKRINFEYEKSDSYVNVAFNSANSIEYGSLYYENTPKTDGEEYSIKLPFEDLNFKNLKDKFQVGYVLKTDYQNYIPKAIILYDYSPTTITNLNGVTYHFSNATLGVGSAYTSYRAFGQEYSNGTDIFGLNFPTQQSTLTNDIVTKGLYDQYYSAYFANIFNYKARLIKVTALLPTSILTSIKLNDNVIIRDAKYLINTMNTDLTTGEVQFELLTDTRI